MIHKLKRRFTVLATVSMILLMTVLVAMMNVINYTTVIRETDEVMRVLSQPDAPFFEKKDTPEKPPEEQMQEFIPRGMSMEVPYESRFFTVSVTEDGTVTDSDMSRILSVDTQTAKKYAEAALKNNKTRGFIGTFRFMKTESDVGTKIIFLDCGRKLDAFYSFLLTSFGVGFLGCLIVFVAFLFVAGKIVKPISEGYEKQKRFISDAGHEIKTPLTIISANVDLLETEGEKEELSEIRAQTKRLTALTRDLVMLSKMEEEKSVQMVDCPFSDIVSETAASFRAVTSAGGIDFELTVEPNVTLHASPDALRQLTSLLLDNAVKYVTKNGRITLTLEKQKKTVVFAVSNTVIADLSESDLSHLFERFYRTDSSRNSETGGHGIGLSIAKAITDSHGGAITPTCSGGIFKMTVTLPL